MKKLQIFAGSIIALLIVSALVYIKMHTTESDVLYPFIGDVLAVICSFIAVSGIAMAINGFKRYDFVKASWIMLFIGLFLYFLAETLYAAYECLFRVDMDLIFPSAADWIWVIGYLPLIIGMLMLICGYRAGGLSVGSKKFYIPFTIGSLAVALFMVIYICIPMVSSNDTSRLAKVVGIIYLVGDLILVMLSVILAYISGLMGRGLASRPWRCIAFGFIFITLSDIAYTYSIWQGSYGSGSFVDIGWNAGYLLIGLAGFCQKELFDSIKGAR